ncbi:MAG: insulinase family protein [Endomicrobium sp.]|jgi:predicted Zn-dependent peptidase|nr:insulinase family protein [Endomicrobium sp.]
MKKIILTLLLFLISQSAFGGEMEEFRLKNNIKVIFDQTNGIGVVSMKVFTPVAAVSETKENAGISVLAANLMVKSTKNRSSEILARDADNIGADLSASVDYDAQHINISFLSEYFDKAAEILSDAVKNPAFNDDEIIAEKKNIIAGLNARKDSIFNTAIDNFTLDFYKNTPYALTVLGSEESLNAVTRIQLEAWHKYSFNSSNILISVSGNIDKKTLKNSLEKYFGDIESGDKFKDSDFGVDNKESKTVNVKGKFNQAYIMKGFPAPNLKSKDAAVLKVAGAVLGGRMTSRLFTELREKLGLAYEVSAIYPSRTHESYFIIYIGLDKKNIDLTLRKIDEILKDICSNEVDEQELKDTKTYIKGLYIMDRQTVGRKSFYYGWRETVGQGYGYDNKYLEDIEKVSSKDILDTLNKIFKQNSLTIIVRPDEK